ncbi:hypothetical protein AVEN_210478-1 [Araneus ventricosus]|uniref:Uncharacterized protein n=1 Tax=Araneus ventricosus TaxID=182803 RepID=A0A4Y2UY46_ARAVE|nr:hypothetical protein AVEN_210478-1 [Araneus ventricosus]
MTRTTPELAPPSPNFHATPTGGRLTTTYDLACNRPHTRRIFSGPSGPKAETLPLGHRGPPRSDRTVNIEAMMLGFLEEK